MSTEMQTCIRNCVDCHQLCQQTLNHCLEMGGKHAEPAHIRTLQDCIEICIVSAGFMLRNSEMHARTCAVCARICERCADDCQRVDPDDPMMKACAEMCRQCAESCQRMAA